MAKLLGNDYRLWVESSTPGTYNEIKGQTSCSVKRAAASIDTSSKDDGAYGTQAPGKRALTLDYSIFPNLPDADGYSRVETLALADPQVPVNFQIRKDGSAGVDADAVFEASMYIGNFDSDFPKDGAVSCTFQLLLASAPTVDELA